MKKSDSLSNDINNKDKDNLIFDSMKEVLHFPPKQIRSNSLLNCFTSNIILEALKTPRTSEYSKLLSQKKEQLKNLSKISVNNSFMSYKFKNQNQKNKSKASDNDRNSFNIHNVTTGYNYDVIDSDLSYDYNNKFELNAPMSLREMNNNKYLVLEKKFHKNNSANNYNINDDMKKILSNKKSNNSFIEKIKNNEGINSKRSFNYDKNKNNNNNSNINYSAIKSKKCQKNKKSLRNIINNNKKYKNYIIITQNSNNKNKTVEQKKNYNAFFESLLSNLKIKNKKIKNTNFNNLYPIHKSKNKKANNNIAENSGTKNSKKRKIKPNESITSSGTISMELINSSTTINNNNCINNNYNLTKQFIAKKNNHLKINLQKSPPPSVNTSKIQSSQKSPVYSTTGRTKEKTKRSIYKSKQTNKNVNTKKCKTPLKAKKQRRIYTNTTSKSTNRKKSNNSIDNNSYYEKCINDINFKGKINPFMDIYNRELLLKDKKEKKLEEMRRQEIADEMLEVRKIPLINELSRKISQNNLPKYRRHNDMKNRKNMRTDRIKEIIITEKEITENTINDRRCDKNNFNKQNFNKWFLSNESWILKKNSKIEKIKNSIDQEISEVEDYTFKPSIDKNSEKIFYQNCLYSKYPVVERLLLSKESSKSLNKNKYEESLPTFVPEINKNYLIRNNYYEFMGENQAEIFKELKEIINNKEKKF